MIKIYTLTDPRTNEVRYVGKTKGTLKRRLNGHMCEARSGAMYYKAKWVRVLIKEGLIPIIEEIDRIDSENWAWLEQYWISQFISWGFNLTNATNGGDGNQGQKQTIESRVKRSNTLKEGYLSGRITCSVERNAKISKALTGTKRSDRTIEKVRQANLGKKYSIEVRKAKSKGGILQFNKDTEELIAEYYSLGDIVEKTGFNKGNISSALNGRVKTCHGFIWKFKMKI